MRQRSPKTEPILFTQAPCRGVSTGRGCCFPGRSSPAPGESRSVPASCFKWSSAHGLLDLDAEGVPGGSEWLGGLKPIAPKGQESTWGLLSEAPACAGLES